MQYNCEVCGKPWDGPDEDGFIVCDTCHIHRPQDVKQMKQDALDKMDYEQAQRDHYLDQAG